MRLVTGPLQTGLYITELVEGPGKYAAVKSDLSKFTLTNDSQSNGAQWFLESMGNDVYRTMSKDLNVAVTHDAKQGTVGVGKGPTEWTIKETDVPGVYRGGPVGRPDLHVCAEINGDQLDMKIGSESKTAVKFRLFRVDE